ncbi:MAG: S8 family serine peptidase, partial [Actinomycetia bacterium]|nr:S8 family serine peptidase [Actinomycetes bacterium]
PAGCDNVMGAGATNNLDEKASFSSHNATVDVTAPGWYVYSTTKSGGYGFGSGTSAATPTVAGLAALILSFNPSLSASQVEQVIEDNALDLGDPGRDDYFGFGRIDAYSSLSDLSSAPVEPPGPTRISPTWFLAEGTTAWEFDCYITIENPNAEDVTAEITYMTPDGPVQRDPLFLPALSQTTIAPSSDLPFETDFSTRVVCKEGKVIAVDRTMWWTGEGAPSPGGHCSVGVTSAYTTWYLPEGSSAWGFECWLLIQNPNQTEATCTVTYMIEGENPVTVEKKVPANSRKSYNMADDIGAKDTSIKVTSDIPVIPERAMYRNNRREGHDSIGTTTPATSYYLAEGTTDWGFTTYVLVQNPNPTDTDVTVTYMTSSGPVPQAPFTMPGNSRKTIRVNDVLPGTDLSTQVTGSQPIIAERAMYWDNGTGEACHDSIGLSSSHTTFYLPDGQTSDGRETYTLVMNPNDTDVTVEISYLTPDGTGNVTFTETITASSRKTFSMVDKGINGRAAVMVTSKTSGKKIMVERAMYWNQRGAGTDTIGGYSD